MITLGSKLYFGLAAVALVAAAVLGLATGASPLGILSFGWSGPIGDQLGYTVLVATAGSSFFLGVVTSAFRDADAAAQAELVGSDTVPAALPPADLSPWPVVAAFGLVAVVIGLVVEELLVFLGIGVLLICAVEWTVTAWADRATGDPAANRAIRNRVMQPIEIPAVALIGIAAFTFFASRMLLALSKWGAIAVFASAATIIMLVAVLIATRPAVSRGVLTAVLLLGGVTLVVGGVVGIGAGERDFHHLGDDGHTAEETDESGDTDTDTGSDPDSATDPGDTEE